MASAQTELSFLFLGDGPFSEKSWRPYEDQSQWWGRRDALVRIAMMSTYQSFGNNTIIHPYARSCSFALVDNDKIHQLDKKQEAANLHFYLMNAATFAKAVPQPRETRIVNLFKDSTRNCRKDKSNHTLSKSIHNTGCICYPDPQLFSPFRSSILAPSNIELNVSENKLPGTSSSVGKRELLIELQEKGSLEFLRQHGLNGSVELILKKKNKAAIDKAYHEWQATKIKPISNASESSQEAICQITTGLNSRDNSLLHAFAGMLDRIAGTGSMAGSQGTSFDKITILILHEDYPNELPVFGHDNDDDNDNDCSSSANRPELVICVMGAVRDVTDIELTCLLKAATGLGIRCVGCNLGRTAEFTSKIVAALHGHATAGRLGRALMALPTVTTNALLKDDCSPQPIIKLNPHRGWTWNGYSTSQVHESDNRKGIPRDHTKMQTNIATDSKPCVSTGVNIRFALFLPFTAADVTAEESQRDKMMHLVQSTVCTLWRSRIGSEHDSSTHGNNTITGNSTNASEGSQRREMMMRTVTEETHCESDAAIEICDDAVVSTLLLCFADGNVVRIERNELTIIMTTQHMAAPSEFQVLTALVSIIRRKVQESEQSCVGRPSDESGSLQCILNELFPDDIARKQRKYYRVVDLMGISSSELASATSDDMLGNQFKKRKLDTAVGSSAKGTMGNMQSHSTIMETTTTTAIKSLAPFAYAKSCACGIVDSASSHSDNTTQKQRNRITIVILLRHSSSSPIHTVHSSAIDLFLQRWFSRQDHDDDNTTDTKRNRMRFLRASLFQPIDCDFSQRSQGSMSPGFAVTMLQHWAYHGRLVAAVDEAIKS